MHPRQDSIGYQNRKYCAHNGFDIKVDGENHPNKQYPDGINQLRKAHQLCGKTFVVISDEIVNKLCINENTWFQQEVTDGGIVLRILNWNEKAGPV